ncbi:hypothetical protein Slin15195_G088890 [Septoria linicola]|uniref:Uncharacterized protein n=1 Tax=Septoria linicola TaxID=215465 RepID=A0A9Q9AZV8_9PEZI|nr:hypothetical protein Slin14017_G091540 [Septoria linicola]USW55570.1 hypothetical protein Slin15195_G088890 [Septoria linicola]
MPQLLVAAVLLLSCLTILIYRCIYGRRAQDPALIDQALKPSAEDPYITIDALDNFDWRSTTPLRNSPLKPKYHLTMALENISLSDIVAMDNTFAERMQIRRQIMDEHSDATVRCNSVCSPAVLELHEWMFGTYLPKRYPTLYKLVPKYDEKSTAQLYNTVSKEYISIQEQDPMAALKTLGGHVDTDFLLLLGSSTSPDGQPLYHLQAFICCFPSGFSLRKKIGLPLSAIHIPVPGYKQKLEKSMDRFFAKLPTGKAVKRSNWAITTNAQLFSEGGNHLYEDGKTAEKVDSNYAHTAKHHGTERDVEKLDLQAQIDAQKATVAVENCRLRSERQTLFRLPKSGAVVFSFKTYQYRLEDVKKEGYGEELAQAIDGLATGNVPEMAFYKRQVVWGDKVKEYLRS